MNSGGYTVPLWFKIIITGSTTGQIYRLFVKGQADFEKGRSTIVNILIRLRIACYINIRQQILVESNGNFPVYSDSSIKCGFVRSSVFGKERGWCTTSCSGS